MKKQYKSFNNDEDLKKSLEDIVRQRKNDVKDFDNLKNLFMSGRKVEKIPSNAVDVADDDRTGDFNYTATYLYILVDDSGTNKWARISLSTSNPWAGATVAADDVTYDNSTSGLTATDVQAAIDEVYEAALYEPEAIALFAEMSSAPTAARKALYSNFISVLKYTGIFYKLDILYLFAAHNEQASRLNIVDPTDSDDTLIATNSPTFTTDTGWQGDASTSYLVTTTTFDNFTYFTQNDASFGVYSLTDSSNNNYYDTGVNDSSNGVRLNCQNGSGNAVSNLNSTGALSAAVGDSLGFYVATRSSSSLATLYKDGTAIDTDATGTLAPFTQTINFLKSRATYSNRQLAAGFWGGGLTASEIGTLQTAIETYLSGVGAI